MYHDPMMGQLQTEITRLEVRLNEIDEKLDRVLAQLSLLAFTAAGAKLGPSEQVKALVHAGDKLGAIKHYRQETGLTLQQAAEAIEALSMADKQHV